MRPEEFYINLQSSDKTLDMLEEWGLLPDLALQKCHNCNGDLKIRVKVCLRILFLLTQVKIIVTPASWTFLWFCNLF